MLRAVSLPASAGEVTVQNSTKLCDLLGSEPDLQTHVKKWKGSFSQKWGAKTASSVTVFNSTKLCQLTTEWLIGVKTAVPATRLVRIWL